MGGLIAVYYAGCVGKCVRTLIISGAGVYLVIPALQRLLLVLLSAISPMRRIALPIDPRELSTDPEVGRRYMEDPLVFKDPTVKLLRELIGASQRVWRYVEKINVPALIMHGADDKIVPVEASRKLYNALKIQNKNLKIYPNMKHEILNEVAKQNVLSDILGWLQSHQ
ncbi:MAG: alpha/beta hydrolase [Candidatus Nezhaarchaeales archaeon]